MKLSQEKIKSLRKKIVFCLILAVVIVGVIFLTRQSKEIETTDPAPIIQIGKPNKATVEESVVISGYVEAKAMIPVVPFVQGTITEYNAKAGDFVTKDTVLAKIDDAPFRQQMLQAQAAYYGYESTFARVESLFKSGASTQQNYDSTKAQRDAAKAQYDLAQLQLDYTQVKAPIDGTILIADLATGSIGTQTQPVAVIADLSNLVVRLKVPEKYFDLFQLQKDNIEIIITRPAEKNMYDDAQTSATIENIAPYISAESKNFQVVCRLDEPGERFRPGMFVKVKASYRIHKDVPTVSITTLKLDGSFYTYDENTQTVSYHVLENQISDGKNVIIPSEFSDSYFVIDGQNSIFDGQEVRVMEDEN